MMESKLQYYMRVCKGASFEKFFKVLDNAHERSGKNKIYLFFDMLHCMKRYGAGYNDYVIFEFWNLDAKQRDTYLTRFRNLTKYSKTLSAESVWIWRRRRMKK